MSIAAIILFNGVVFEMTLLKSSIRLHQLSVPQLNKSLLSTFSSRISYFGMKRKIIQT